jgi:hypothetical protein
MARLIYFPWLREEDWALWTALDLELTTYEAWLEEARRSFEGVEGQRNVPVKVEISATDFAAWNRGHGYSVGRHARASYAGVMGRKPKT